MESKAPPSGHEPSHVDKNDDDNIDGFFDKISFDSIVRAKEKRQAMEN